MNGQSENCINSIDGRCVYTGRFCNGNELCSEALKSELYGTVGKENSGVITYKSEIK